MKTASDRFIAWMGMSIGVGSLPFVVNFIVHYVVGDMSFNSVFRVSELMFFCILLNVTTMYDLFLLHKSQSKNLLITGSWFGLLVLTLVFAAILGVSSFFTAVQPVRDLFDQIELRLSSFSLVLAIGTLIADVALQIYITSQLAEK